MKKETSLALQKYRATLVDAVKAGTKLNTARKALLELTHTYAVETALMEIIGNLEHYNRVVRNTTHNIAVLELREGI